MALRLDPRVPLVWRDPHTLQLGVDAPRAVLHDVTPAAERLVAALQRGVGDDGFDAVCTLAGVTPSTRDAVLEALRPALLHDHAAPVARIDVDGDGPAADAIAEALGRRGHRITRGNVHDRDPELAVLVRHFAVPPRDYGHWLRRDVPHLAIVFGDAEARIGPLVEPGDGPCLFCQASAAADADPAWPAIASQLLGRRSSSDEGPASLEVAALAARTVLERVENGRRALNDGVVHLDVVTGARRREALRPHPGCACRALPGNVTALASRPADPTSPSSARAAAARA